MGQKVKSYPVTTCAQYGMGGVCKSWGVLQCKYIEAGVHDCFGQCPVKLIVGKGN